MELFIEENKKRGCGCWAAAATADAGKLEVLKTVEAACLPAATASAATADFWRLEFRTAEGACELAAAAAAAANAVGCGSCVCLCFVAVARLEQAQVPLTWSHGVSLVKPPPLHRSGVPRVLSGRWGSDVGQRTTLTLWSRCRPCYRASRETRKDSLSSQTGRRCDRARPASHASDRCIRDNACNGCSSRLLRCC